MKRILVTGGAGFLGRHLCARLLADGHYVICLDNFFTGTRQNVVDLLDQPRFELIPHDICAPIHIEVDEIYNLACPASPVYYQRDPVQTVKTNIQGAINILDLAWRCGAKVFQASTSEVYGDPHVHPQREDYWGHVNPIGARACYDEGKRCAETLFFSYHQQHALPIKIARIFNTYGPYMQQDDGRVVSNFIVQALRNQPITLYGDGTQTRSFCYVSDLINGLVRLMATGPELTGPINLGNVEECPIVELARKVVMLTHSRSRFVFRPLPGDDPRQRRPDINQARQLLDWMPRVELLEGLGATIAYFDAVLSRPRIRRHARPVSAALFAELPP